MMMALDASSWAFMGSDGPHWMEHRISVMMMR